MFRMQPLDHAGGSDTIRSIPRAMMHADRAGVIDS